MILATSFDDFRHQVLEPEGLADPSRFVAGDFFDEIPLYSRYAQVEPFLRGKRSPDNVLLDMALEYLAEVCGEAKLRRGFVAAITIPDDAIPGDAIPDEKEFRYLVPSLFVCKGNIRRRLNGLRLRKPLTAFGKRIAAVLKQVDPKSTFGILEDTLTVPGQPRVFISYPNMLDQVVSVGVAEE